jgi:8-oxo-dGTP pyrophosphatase MutT (NUDIX family)
VSGAASAAGAAPVPEWLRDLAAAATTMRIPRYLRPPSVGGRQSAVLILFAEGPHGPDLLYIQRSEGLRHHPGQPAFPGGGTEETDSSPEETALREAVEETGLVPSGVEVVGRLPELYVLRSDNRVVPVLAWWRDPSEVRPTDLTEVAAVERIPVATLADPGNRLMLAGPSGYLGPAFDVGPMLIWGFTGMLTDRLLALAGWERPWDTTITRGLPEGA